MDKVYGNYKGPFFNPENQCFPLYVPESVTTEKVKWLYFSPTTRPNALRFHFVKW